ncbi:MAG: formylglycine-generating enzyme family protein, partial [bacterium]|nr:formylglycine-generating enzyme family protein [bacterium]
TGSQDNTTTEDGAYTLTPTGIANNTVTRNPGAVVFLPSEDEWYKAAYYDTSALVYFDYPAGSDTQTTCAVPGALPNTANCNIINGYEVSNVGSYTAALSPGGTLDQGGNVTEWNEAIMGSGDASRGRRGAAFVDLPSNLAASIRWGQNPALAQDVAGIRLAGPAPAVPSMNVSGMAILFSLLGIAGYRRLRA